MRGDAHVHLFRRGFGGDAEDGAELDAYRSIAAREGIGHALVVAYEGSVHTRGNSAYLLDVAVRHPWLHPTAYIDLSAPPPPSWITDAVRIGVEGFSLYPNSEAQLCAAFSAAHCRELDDARAVLSINLPGIDYDAVRDFACLVPRATILLSHLGSAFDDPSRAPRGLLALATLPNVAVKLSGLYAFDPPFPHLRVADRVAETLDAFGAGRLLCGSDYPPALTRLTEQEVFSLPPWFERLLSVHERRRIMHGNLLDLLQRDGRDVEAQTRRLFRV